MTTARPDLRSTAPARRSDDWFMGLVPSARLAIFRLLVGLFSILYLLARIPSLAQLPQHPDAAFDPVGPVDLLLDSPVDGWVIWAAVAGALVTGVAFVLGWRFAVTGPLHAALLLLVLSYASSFGTIRHADTLLVLHAGILALSPASVAISVAPAEARLRRPWVSGWPLRLAGLATVITFVVGGITRLRNGGVDWVRGDTLRDAVGRENIAQDQLDTISSPVAAWALGQSVIWPAIAVLSLLVAFCAPLALVGGRIAVRWVALAWVLAVIVLLISAQALPYYLLGVAFAPLFALEQGATRVDRGFDRLRLRFNRKRRDNVVQPI